MANRYTLKIIVMLFLLSLSAILFVGRTSSALVGMEGKTDEKIDPPHGRLFILSIDGGGIRGIVPALVLKNLESRLKKGKKLQDCFDIMAGTSTGGLIVLLLNAPDKNGQPLYTIDDVISFYKELGAEVFDDSLWQKIKSGWGWFGPKYSEKKLCALLEKYLGESELKDTVGDIFVPSYDIELDETIFLRTNRARKDPKRNLKLKDIAKAIIAAPTYFSPARVQSVDKSSSYTFVDGGIGVNNPALAASVYATETYGYDDDFFILSLGTGTNYGAMRRKIPHEDVQGAGLLGWIKKIIPVMMYAVNDVTHHQMEVFFNHLHEHKDYYRLQVTLEPEHSDMDNVSPDNIAALEGYAAQLVQENEAMLREIADTLNK